jgi:hypothetical protein
MTNRDPFEVPATSETERLSYSVPGLLLERILTARCEDGEHGVFECVDAAEAVAYATGLLEADPFIDPPRFCHRCEIRRDVLGIRFERAGPIPRDELQQLASEPRD